ncbi:hypothetical protein J4573_09135 [Actinomadura barringtoniae]|uniref:Uncharacterized protein n=1 Tax=Actinomadura barringtoniae TaxID=1427535 RepID=A0A939T1B8_9ACTN|nr:hypothetical protein [Actinomadura barringtoniae]MBO2447246.1 hypothetical protein [Actinomadura barringtoniae]
MALNRVARVVTGAAVAATALTATALGADAALASAPQHSAKPDKAKESHVTGDAWVNFPGDTEYPYRRFIVDAHGAPWRYEGKKMVMGDAHGTIKINHFSPDKLGRPSVDHWFTVKVDYLMATGPTAVVSGIWQADVPANQKRANLTFYQSPLGHKYDRMGFSWGVVDARCQQMGTGPAPFSPASPGPYDHWLKGYTIKEAPLPIRTDFVPPDAPADCTFKDPA